ncbi:MAG: hypothetical protein A2754_01160 [Candidatus Magasanikbacteria bacterium RIFCSPHIGHO2_01_FULL_47_8]|uniref:DUF11 domain-containing protein n=1 Tax=Candidatus Magasanikbacteria bacterium RIFCSPHIGHO2_01_FULL_47_8 TaxID=1798673 RepID=A0A1F6MC35_9BACT|nr:MAG: hypothetical protein A2754_01160 [Candidatus Magasanikbacteria bacterium RIFCSPHIGHO2_01_FULL_47_8]
MPEDQPLFSTKPIVEEKPKRRAPRRAESPLGGARRASSRSRKPSSSANQKEINDSLTAIYQDDSGRFPDMKEIAIKKSRPFLRLISIIVLGGAALATLAWTGFIFTPGNHFPEDKVALEIRGPDHLGLGATSTYYITYKNNYSEALKDVTLNVYYPVGFTFGNSSPSADNAGHNEWRIGNIPANQGGAITVEGKNYGTLNEQKSWRVFLNYKPTNFNSDLQKSATLTTVIDSSPFSLSVSGPDKASLGAEVEYSFNVKNDGDWAPSSLQLSPVLPANFTISSSTPALDKNNRWSFSLLSPTKATSTAPSGQSLRAAPTILKNLTFKIKGKFGTTEDKTSPIKGILLLPTTPTKAGYQIAVAEIASELIKNDLSYNMAINGSVNDSDSQPDDILNITIHIKNTNAKDIKNVTVALVLDTPSVKRQSILKWPEIVDQYDGTIQGEQLTDDIRRGTVTWNSKKIPALARIKPNDEINIDVRLPIKGEKDFDLSAIKISKIMAASKLTFTDQTGTAQTINANPITITLNSDLKFENRDTVSTNPEGKEQHAVTWVLTNSFHALKNIEISADAYGDLSFAPGSAAAGTVTYAPDTKKISWKIAELPESIDVANAAFTIIINKKNPTQNTLLSKVHIQAEDAVTGKKLDFMGEEVSLAN